MKQVDNEEYIHTKLTRGKSDNETVKILDKYYGFDEAIQDLEKFIDRHILYDKEKWLKKIENYKKERNISFRNFNVELAKYGKKYKDKGGHVPYTKEEEEMLRDLMHYWGE